MCKHTNTKLHIDCLVCIDCGEVLEEINPVKVDRMMCRDSELIFSEGWIGKKARNQILDYRKINPSFNKGYQYLEYVSSLKPKVQRWRVYQPISKWINQVDVQRS